MFFLWEIWKKNKWSHISKPLHYFDYDGGKIQRQGGKVVACRGKMFK
jgi:hypothetical protein